VVYTAPASGVVVVRDIVMSVRGVFVAGQLIAVEANSGSAPVRLASQSNPSNVVVYHIDLRQVLQPGDTLAVGVLLAQTLEYRISGYLLGT
jgi:hypothetical protein